MALPVNKNISMVRGDTLVEILTLEDADNQPFDLTEYEVKMDIKLSKDAPPMLSLVEGDGLTKQGTSGIITIKIDPAKTNDFAFSGNTVSYVYDVEINQILNGSRRTIVEGNFVIYKDVTR